jgi:hypothetical protein
MVVADKYKLTQPLSINAGTWKKDGVKEHIHRKIVTRDFVENRNSHTNNELYIIDEEATLEMIEQREKNIILNAEKSRKEKMTTSDLVEAIIGNQKPKVKKPKAEKTVKVEDDKKPNIELPEGEPNIEWSIGQIQSYCKVNNIKFHHMAKAEKLLELINA